MSKFCCEEFDRHTKLEDHEAGALQYWNASYGWVIVADGGAWAAWHVKFCPWCGAKLNAPEA